MLTRMQIALRLEGRTTLLLQRAQHQQMSGTLPSLPPSPQSSGLWLSLASVPLPLGITWELSMGP